MKALLLILASAMLMSCADDGTVYSNNWPQQDYTFYQYQTDPFIYSQPYPYVQHHPYHNEYHSYHQYHQEHHYNNGGPSYRGGGGHHHGH